MYYMCYCMYYMCYKSRERRSPPTPRAGPCLTECLTERVCVCEIVKGRERVRESVCVSEIVTIRRPSADWTSSVIECSRIFENVLEYSAGVRRTGTCKWVAFCSHPHAEQPSTRAAIYMQPSTRRAVLQPSTRRASFTCRSLPDHARV